MAQQIHPGSNPSDGPRPVTAQDTGDSSPKWSMPKTFEVRLKDLAGDIAGIGSMVTMIAQKISRGDGEADALFLIAKSARSFNDALCKIADEAAELAKKIQQTVIDEQKEVGHGNDIDDASR